MTGFRRSHRVALLVSLLCALLLPSNRARSESFTTSPGSIIGGEPVAEGEYPWMVGLRYIGDQEPFCGGAVIESEWILTAAHCFFDGSELDTFASDLEVVAGTVDLRGEGGAFARVSSIHHPGYDGDRNDIALLRLRSPLPTTSDLISMISLNYESTFPPVGVAATIAGWGATRADGSGSPQTLQQVDVPITECDGGDDGRSTICAGGVSGRDSCGGDSGGPLFVSDEGRWIQVGIASSGEDVCGLGSFYGLYTRVSFHSAWIESVVSASDGAGEDEGGLADFYGDDLIDYDPYADQVLIALVLIGLLFLGLFLLGLLFYLRRRRRPIK